MWSDRRLTSSEAFELVQVMSRSKTLGNFEQNTDRFENHSHYMDCPDRRASQVEPLAQAKFDYLGKQRQNGQRARSPDDKKAFFLEQTVIQTPAQQRSPIQGRKQDQAR